MKCALLFVAAALLRQDEAPEEEATAEMVKRIAFCIDPAAGRPGSPEAWGMEPYVAAARAVKLDAQMLHTRLVIPGVALGKGKGTTLGLARRSSRFQHLIASMSVPSVKGGLLKRAVAGAKAHASLAEEAEEAEEPYLGDDRVCCCKKAECEDDDVHKFSRLPDGANGQNGQPRCCKWKPGQCPKWHGSTLFATTEMCHDAGDAEDAEEEVAAAEDLAPASVDNPKQWPDAQCFQHDYSSQAPDPYGCGLFRRTFQPLQQLRACIAPHLLADELWLAHRGRVVDTKGEELSAEEAAQATAADPAELAALRKKKADRKALIAKLEKGDQSESTKGQLTAAKSDLAEASAKLRVLEGKSFGGLGGYCSDKFPRCEDVDALRRAEQIIKTFAWRATARDGQYGLRNQIQQSPVLRDGAKVSRATEDGIVRCFEAAGYEAAHQAGQCLPLMYDAAEVAAQGVSNAVVKFNHPDHPESGAPRLWARYRNVAPVCARAAMAVVASGFDHARGLDPSKDGAKEWAKTIWGSGFSFKTDCLHPTSSNCRKFGICWLKALRRVGTLVPACSSSTTAYDRREDEEDGDADPEVSLVSVFADGDIAK